MKLADQINIYRYKDLLDDSGNSPQKKPAPKFSKKTGDEEADQIALDAEAFIKFRSCGIDEIKMKIMAEPEAHKDTSVFIASRAQLEKAKQRERMLRQMARQ